MRKFTMELVWHNCYLYPPSEAYNESLYVTDGNEIMNAIYDVRKGWLIRIPNTITVFPLPSKRLTKYWWADIKQTVQGEEKFDN